MFAKHKMLAILALLLLLLLLLRICAAPTLTPVPPTATPIPPPTATPVPPTATLIPPTPTATLVPPTPTPYVEKSVATIPITGSLAHRRSEVSGMAWYGDNLIILPQYPDFEKRRNIDLAAEPVAFALAKADILAVLDGAKKDPLNPKRIKFVDEGVLPKIDADGFNFQGYEAMVFIGDRACAAIEAESKASKSIMQGYLLCGKIEPDLSALRLDATTMAKIKPPAELANMAFEALMVVDGKLLAFYEANGAGVNKSPLGSLFDQKTLAAVGTVPLSNIEYRLTDTTPLDSTGKFWGINYHFPGETELLKAPATDPIAAKYSKGATHAKFPQVERLVEFQYKDTGIVLTDTPPIQLVLLDEKTARNWEAIVRLDGRGFLIMTDTFPDTILAFVPLR